MGGSNEPVSESLIPYVSLVMPNESELEWISGHSCSNSENIDDVRDAVSILRKKWGRDDLEVLVTLGKHGAIYFAKDNVEHRVYAFKNICVKDTTGAGDCFRGSFAAARYSLERSILESLQWASAAASLCVETHGAMPSMPSRDLIERRLRDGEINDK